MRLQDAIEYARQNPDDTRSKALREAIISGQMDSKAQEEGVDLSWAGRPALVQKPVDAGDTMQTAQVAKPKQSFFNKFQSFVQSQAPDFAKVKEESARRAKEIGQGYARGEQGLAQTIFQAGGEAIQAGFEGVAELPILKSGLQLLGQMIRGASEAPPIKAIAGTQPVQNLTQRYEGLSPAGKRNVNATLQYLSALPYEKAGEFAARLGMKTLEGVDFNAVKESIAKAKAAVPEAIKSPVQTLQSTANAPLRWAEQLRTNVRESLSKGSVDPRLEASAERLSEQQGVQMKDPLTKYDEFYAQEQKFKGDIKQDTALSMVGEHIGTEFEKIVAQKRAVGKRMAEELKKVSNVKTDATEAFTKLEEELNNNGLAYDSEDGLMATKSSKVPTDEVKLLNEYIGELNNLGATPTIGELDAFISRVSDNLDLYKAKRNIYKVTNGERIIKNNLRQLREQLNPEITGNTALEPYFKARTAYSELSNFIDEGTTYLGKKTQSGDFAKDASMAKSSVQSVLNNGKKDWLIKLEGLTGYPALDETVLALQAMKDAGNFRGLSLLEKLNEGSVPTSKWGVADRIITWGAEKGKRLIVGTPNEQTRTFLQSLNREASSSGINTEMKTSTPQTMPTTKATGGATNKSTNQIKKPIEPDSTTESNLEQEARKYKSAEEFVKAQESQYLYHGTNKTTLEAITEQGIVPQRRGVSSLSKTEDYAKNWSDNPYTKTKGVMFRVKKDAVAGQIVKRKGSMPETDRQFEILTNKVIPPSAIEVKTPTGWRTLTTNEPRPTKSQLTDIWKKANAQPVKSTLEINTPERIALRENVANQLYGTGAANKNRVADIVTGASGSGKSVVFAEPIAKKNGSLIIDSDKAKKLLPEVQDNLKNSGLVHDESSVIAMNVLKKAIANGDNIVIPIVGKSRSSVTQILDALHESGYTTNLHHVEINMETALKRAKERFERTGQYVPEEYIRMTGTQPTETFKAITTDPNYSSKLNQISHFQNDIEGAEPKLISAKAEKISAKAEELTKKNGGVTITLNGDIPTKGFVFSPFKDSETIIPMENFSTVDIDNFIEKWYNRLGQSEHHLGLWIDEGKVYIDVSKVIADEQRAVVESLSAGQIGLFDLENFITKYLKDYEKTGSTYSHKGKK